MKIEPRIGFNVFTFNEWIYYRASYKGKHADGRTRIEAITNLLKQLV